MANRLRRVWAPTRRRSRWSIATTRTSTSRGCCSCRSASPRRTHLVRPRHRQLHRDVVFIEAEIDQRRHGRKRGAPGRWACASLRRPDRCDRRAARAGGDRGHDRAGWLETVFPFYTAEGATALADALERFDGGTPRREPVDMPIKCPVAPLEFTFLADWYLARARDPRPHGARLRDAARRRVHQAHRIEMLAGLLDVEGRPGRHGVQRRRGRRGRWHAPQLRRARAAVRPARDDPAARRRRVHRPLARPRRRRRASCRPTCTRCSRRRRPTCSRSATPRTCRPRRRAPSRTSRPTRSPRTSGASSHGRAARGLVRRPRELLHRDGIPQGAADRLQLRRRAASGPLPVRAPRAVAAAARVARQPPRQAALPVGLLARAAAWPRHPRHQPAAPPPHRQGSTHEHRNARRHDRRLDAEGFLTDPSQWSEEIAEAIAARERHRAADRPALAGRALHARGLSARRPGTQHPDASARPPASPIKELYQLFPKGPAKLAAKIGGIPKPHGCI